MTARKAPPKPVAKPRETVASVKAAHAKDLQTLAEHMKRVADTNGFCSLFWEELDEVNAKLTTPIAVDRKRDAQVELSLTVTGRFVIESGRYGSIDPEAEEELLVRIGDAVDALGYHVECINVEECTPE